MIRDGFFIDAESYGEALPLGAIGGRRCAQCPVLGVCHEPWNAMGHELDILHGTQWH